jgi:hypothetical protein
LGVLFTKISACLIMTFHLMLFMALDHQHLWNIV